MNITRREFIVNATATASTLAIAPIHAHAEEPPAAVGLGLLLYSYGIRNRAEKEAGFGEPSRFLEFARSRGANAVQMPLGIRTEEQAAAIRGTCDKFGMHLEGIVSPPADNRAGLDRFTSEIATAKACGVRVVRTVMLGGRRYETFTKAEDYPAFAKQAEATLLRAEPVARKHGVKLAVENHKDFRADEQVDLLKRLKSEFVGVCLDTGNNLALLEQPLHTIDALAPFVLTAHLKDMGVEEAADGFRLAEVPLGQGILDLKAIVERIRKANPAARFQLEMITRDPLSIPCLTEKYWATLERVPGRDLARTLALVRASVRKEPLPRLSTLDMKGQLNAEDANVRASFAFAAKSGLFPV